MNEESASSGDATKDGEQILANEVFNKLTGEFNHPSLRWIKRLLEKPERSWSAPAIKFLVAAGFLAGFLAWLAGSCGFALIFKYVFTPPPGQADMVITYTHVLGFLGEANFAIWLIIGLPIFVWLTLDLLQRTARGFGEMKSQLTVRAGVDGEQLFPAWSQSKRLGWFWIIAAIAVWIASFGIQVRESIHARNPPWLVSDPNVPSQEPKVLLDEFSRSDGGFDFGNTWAPFLERSIVKPFNGLALTDKIKVLKNCREAALVVPWSCYNQQIGPMVGLSLPPPPDEIAKSLASALKGGKDAITLSVHPQTTLFSPSYGLVYWLFVFFTYGLTGLGWVIATWALTKVWLALRVVRLALNPNGIGIYQISPDWSERMLGLKPLFYGSKSLLWLGVFGAAYVTLMRSVPVSYATRDGSSHFLRGPYGGFTPQSERIDQILVCAYLVIVAFGLARWYFAYERLRKHPPKGLTNYRAAERDSPAFQTWGTTLIVTVALGLPFLPYFSNSIADKVLKLPVGAKHAASAIFGLPKHGGRKVDVQKQTP